MTSVLCSRIACLEQSVALLLIAPAECHAWLVTHDHPSAREGVPLCEKHVERVSVPDGWELDDERALSRSTKRRRKKSKPVVEAPTEVVADLSPSSAALAADPPAEDIPVEDVPLEQVRAEIEEEPVAEEALVEEAVAAEPAPAPVDLEADLSPADTDEADDGADDPTIQVASVVVPAEEAQHALADDEPTREIDLAIPGDPGDAAAEAAAGRHLRTDGPTGREGVIHGDAPVGLEAPALAVVPEDESFDYEEDGQGSLLSDTGSHLITGDTTPLLKRAFRVVEDG